MAAGHSQVEIRPIRRNDHRYIVFQAFENQAHHTEKTGWLPLFPNEIRAAFV